MVVRVRNFYNSSKKKQNTPLHIFFFVNQTIESIPISRSDGALSTRTQVKDEPDSRRVTRSASVDFPASSTHSYYEGSSDELDLIEFDGAARSRDMPVRKTRAKSQSKPKATAGATKGSRKTSKKKIDAGIEEELLLID